jgi:hypothetical protein
MLQKLQVQKEYSLSPPNLVFSNTVFNDKSIKGIVLYILPC